MPNDLDVAIAVIKLAATLGEDAGLVRARLALRVVEAFDAQRRARLVALTEDEFAAIADALASESAAINVGGIHIPDWPALYAKFPVSAFRRWASTYDAHSAAVYGRGYEPEAGS